MNAVRTSMSLLDEIADGALEPGYRLAADRAPRTSSGRAVFHLGVVLVLVVAGFVIALALSDVRRDAPDAAASRHQLVDRVRDATSSTDELATQVSALRAQVARARDQELATTRGGRARADELARLELVTGASAASGPGVRVRVDNAPATPPGPGADGQQSDLGTVQDRDLQLVVNGMWAAGAEAVAVDGYRITARTAIRTAGEAILVDFRPVSAPYVIEAVGDRDRLRTQFLDGPGGRALSTLAATYGIRFATESVGSLTLPAAASLGDGADSTRNTGDQGGTR